MHEPRAAPADRARRARSAKIQNGLMRARQRRLAAARRGARARARAPASTSGGLRTSAYRSIASATPSCATSATTWSACANSSGGPEPIATPTAAASSSGNRSRRRRPRASRRAARRSAARRTRAPRPCSPPGSTISTKSTWLRVRYARVAEQRAQRGEMLLGGSGSSTRTILIVGRSANAARSDGTTTGSTRASVGVALREAVDLLDVERVVA